MLAEMYHQNRFLSNEECDSVISFYRENQQHAVRGTFGYPPNTKVDLNRRICKTLVLHQNNETLKPIIDRVYDVVKTVNEDIFMFNIDWNYNRDKNNKAIWITEYDGAEKGHWSSHQNVNWISNHMQKKICASILLSDSKDYEGGDILLYFGQTKDIPTPTELRGRGLLYVYPAFRITQINPVLSGYKYHFDFEFSGPYWR